MSGGSVALASKFIRHTGFGLLFLLALVQAAIGPVIAKRFLILTKFRKYFDLSQFAATAQTRYFRHG